MNEYYYLARELDDGDTTVPNNAEAALCNNKTGVQTGMGCVPFTNTNQLGGTLVRWGIGIGAGIALVLIALASFQIMTSAGDPKRLEEGRGILYAALSGVTLIAMSAFVLRLLGINVLGLF